MIEIREANIEDSKDLIILLDSLGYPNSESFIEEKILAHKLNSQDNLIVAQLEEKIVGFISFSFITQFALKGDFCRINYFCVKEEFRGNKIGELLELYVVNKAKKKACDRIEVHCHERRKDAHRFYFRLEYEESPKYLIKSLLDIR